MASKTSSRFALLLLAFSLASTGVLAQPTEEAKKAARAHMAEGRTARDDNKDYKSALESFRKAHQIMKVPTTGLEVARTLMLMGHFIEAEEAANDVASLPVAPKEPEPFTKAREESKKIAEEAKSKIGYVKVNIKTDDKKAIIEATIDGLGVAPDNLKGPIKQNPGKHTIAVKGAKPESVEVEVGEGSTKEVAFEIKTIKKDTAPAVTSSAPPPPPPPEEKSSFMRPMPLVGFGLAGAGLIAGTITGFLTLSKASAAKEKCVDNRCPPAAHDDISSGKTMGLISTISFGVAGVGAVIGVIGLMQKPDTTEKPAASKLRVSPWIGVNGAGVVGQF